MSFFFFIIIFAVNLLVKGQHLHLNQCSVKSCDINGTTIKHHITTDLLRAPSEDIIIPDESVDAVGVDECAFEEIGDKILYFGQKRVTWFTAFRQCRLMNGILLSLDNETLAQEIFDYLEGYYPEHDLWWVSGSDLDEEGKFYWYGTGKPVENFHWSKKQPDNKDWREKGTENCIHLWQYYGKHEMNDARCNSRAYPICEIPKPLTFKIRKLLPLIESKCSNRARFLLCSSLFPLCTPDVPRPVTACKTLCESVRSECSFQTDLFQLWPEYIKCEHLPQPEKQELCMQIPEDKVNSKSETPSTLSLQTITESFPKVNLPLPRKLQTPLPLLNSNNISSNRWSWMNSLMQKHLNPAFICPHNFTINPDNRQECVPQCNRDGFHTTQQKKIAESLILCLSAICFVLTLFSLVTFWAEPTRFGYPERPVLFLCLCYNLFSVCFLERIVFHNPSRTFAILEDPLAKLHACNLTPPCLASYITTSYLSLCATNWWLIFSVCFYLSSHKKWSSEALEKKSGVFHVLAWVPPLALPIAALLMEKVKPNELTSMCSAPGFVEIPATVVLLLGFFFTLRTAKSLHILQQQMLPTFSHQRFSQIRKRFLVFSLVFFTPTLMGVVATFFEQHQVTVPVCSIMEECGSPPVITVWPTFSRLFFQLMGGTLTGMWVWSRKTCESYRNRLVTTPTSSLTTGTMKSAATHSKKHLHLPGKSTISATLYSGINFHNVPVYSSHLQRL